MTNIQSIRNIAITGHHGGGKTTLIERLLFATKAIPAMGDVTDKNTVSDHCKQSRECGHSIENSFVNLSYQQQKINIIDTPGYPDLLGRAISVLPAVETVAIVIDAQDGIEMVTERMMEAAELRNKCRLIIINKADATDINFNELIGDIQKRFGNECLPINLPAKDSNDILDCYFKPEYKKTSEFSTVESVHDALIDQVVEVDEDLMELYLEQGQAITPEQLHDPFETALRSGHLVPICFVSAREGQGIDLLLNIFSQLMPNPIEGNPPLFLNNDKPVELKQDINEHVLGHVFKVSIDPFVGRLAYVRLHQGSIAADSQLFINDSKKTFKTSHIFAIQGGEKTEIESAFAGDIIALAKHDELEFDSVVHDSHDEDYFHLEPLEFPPPMFELAIHPKKRGDEQRLSEILKKLCAEDPSLHLEHRVNLNETILQGVGETHLTDTLHKMAGEFHLAVDTSQPKIDYRETISKLAKGSSRHKKQSGGAGQFGEVHLEVSPLPRGEEFEFENRVVGGAIPGNFIPAIEKGIRQIMAEGAIAGFKMQDIKVSVYDGKHHAVDSKEIAFVSAGRKAFLEAIRSADPKILEPMVNVTVIVPEPSMGDITADLASHRGMINATSMLSRQRMMVRATLPLMEMNDYSSRLKTMTGGEGTFTLEMSHYDNVTPSIQDELCKGYKVKELQ